MRLGIKEIRQKRFKRKDPPPLWEGDSPSYLAEPLLLGGGAKAALNVPPPIYTRGFGLFEKRYHLSLTAQPYLSSSSSAVLRRSPAGIPCFSTTTTPSCCCWRSSPTSPSSLLDQGAGDVTGLYVC